MPYTLLLAVGFGSTKTGLATVGYQLKNADATNNGTRITAGIVEVGNGYYQASVSIPDTHSGGILWDTGEATPKYVYQDINPGVDEYTDAKISSRAVGMGTGVNTVTITLTETGGTPVIPGATVSVKNQANDTLLATGTTDANGQVVFMLDNGTYSVDKQKLGSYSFTNPETLVVSGNTNQSYIGTPISVSAPAQPNTCRMFIWARNLDGTLMTTLTGNVTIIKLPYTTSGAAYQKDDTIFILHADGYFYVDVVYGATISIYIPVLGVDTTLVVPSQTTYDLDTLI
ncbi:MAG: carboxypeptidase-like regulatory domain-containing protein [bacterium]